MKKQLGVPLRVARLWRIAALAAVVTGTGALPSSGIGAQAGSGYGLNWHAVVSGGVVRARNSCFRLSGTTAQAAVTPGVISSPDVGGNHFTVFSGIWSAAPIAGQDQMFFDGFEGCKP